MRRVLTDVFAAGHRALDAVVACLRSVGQVIAATVEPWLAPGGTRDASVLRLVRPLPARRIDSAATPSRAAGARRPVVPAIPVSPPMALAADAGALPAAYGTDHAVLVARNPGSLFVYWEVSPLRRVSALRALGDAAEHGREVLRVLALGDDGSPRVLFDVDLPPDSARWYVDVPAADAAYRVAVGLRTADGRFVPLVESNPARTPPARPSENRRVEWVRLQPTGSPTPVARAWSGRRVPDVASPSATSASSDTLATAR